MSAFLAPSSSYLGGSDALGRDLLLRAVQSLPATIWVSLIAALLTITLAFAIAVARLRWKGQVFQTATEWLTVFAWSLPAMLIATLAFATVGSKVLALVATLVLLNWVAYTRQLEDYLHVLGSKSYIRFAQTQGLSKFQTARLHYLPVLKPVLMKITCFALAEALAIESSLSIVGLSFSPNSPTMGGLIAEGSQYMAASPWVVVTPAFCLLLLLWCCYLAASRIKTVELRR
jgi:ABC-type dipeptide/oligopeptide/nickel transport system permease subunit